MNKILALIEKNREAQELDAAEFFELHDEDCCSNSEYGCDVGIGMLECCDNMKKIAAVLNRGRLSLLETLIQEIEGKRPYSKESNEEYLHGEKYKQQREILDSLLSPLQEAVKKLKG